MPSVDVAMARSLQGGMWEKLTRSVVSTISQRSIVDDTQNKVTDVKTAFSSWDNCMNAYFCKWPVIAVMIIGGLIILAVLWCVIRCTCLAKSCCCSCFACLKCCGNCCGCCDPPGSRKHKYLDEPYIPPHQGYQSQGPMHANYPPVMGGASHGVTPPQYAEFDMKKGGEDSLPSMPSWEGAGSRKVSLEQESHEMNNLKSPLSAEPKDPLLNGMSPTSPMPRENPASPYGRSTPGTSGAMLPAPAGMTPRQPPPRDPYALNNSQPGNRNNNPYDASDDGFGLDEPYALPPAGTPVNGMGGPGARNSPAPGQGPFSPAPGVMAGAMGPGGRNSPAPGQNPYGGPGPMVGGMGPGGRNSPAPGQNPYSGPGPMAGAMGPGGRNSPAPSQNGYGRRMNQGFAEMPAGPIEPHSTNPYDQNSSPTSPMGMAPPYGMRNGTPGQETFGSRTTSPGPGGFRGPPPNRGGNNSPAPYGMEPRMRTPGPPPGARASPRPQGDPYAPSPRQTPVSANGPGGFAPPAASPVPRGFSPAPIQPPAQAPDRQFAQSPRPLQRPVAPASPLARDDNPGSPIVNSGGFDFTSGFSRPQTSDSDHYDRRPSESKEAGGHEGYPGYKPYRPAQEGWSGV